MRVPVVNVPHAFVEHADAWRAQTVPRALASPRLAHFVARYETRPSPAPPSAIEPGTETSVVQEWPSKTTTKTTTTTARRAWVVFLRMV